MLVTRPQRRTTQTALPGKSICQAVQRRIEAARRTRKSRCISLSRRAAWILKARWPTMKFLSRLWIQFSRENIIMKGAASSSRPSSTITALSTIDQKQVWWLLAPRAPSRSNGNWTCLRNRTRSCNSNQSHLEIELLERRCEKLARSKKISMARQLARRKPP